MLIQNVQLLPRQSVSVRDRNPIIWHILNWKVGGPYSGFRRASQRKQGSGSAWQIDMTAGTGRNHPISNHKHHRCQREETERELCQLHQPPTARDTHTRVQGDLGVPCHRYRADSTKVLPSAAEMGVAFVPYSASLFIKSDNIDRALPTL